MPVDRIGFGSGRGNVVADMTASTAGAFGNASAYSFSVGFPNNVRLPKAKEAVAQNTAIAAALAAADAAPEKLSPDVEAQARRLGLAIADNLIAHAKEQGWQNKPEGKPETKPDEPKVSANESSEQMVRLPSPKPAKKPKA
jgi:hypothetical protein